MKQYKIQYIIFGNFQSWKIFSFDNEPTKEECKFWLWNILNEYEKDTLDWDLLIEDIEIITVREYIPLQGAVCNVGYPNNISGICFTSKPTHKED
jgi:hypothetical protein